MFIAIAVIVVNIGLFIKLLITLSWLLMITMIVNQCYCTYLHYFILWVKNDHWRMKIKLGLCGKEICGKSGLITVYWGRALIIISTLMM